MRSSWDTARAAASGLPTCARRPQAALGQGFSVALVEQPYRVAGRRSPPPAAQLDTAWQAVIEALAAGPLNGLPLITGGRSAGARVACRTAAATGARGVLCLAFPLQPPARKSGTQSPDRLHELQAVKVPVLIVQGSGDPFGMPPAGRRRKVVKVAGNHSLKQRPARARHGGRSVARPSGFGLRRVAVVQAEHVPVGILEERHVADARVDRVGDELDALRLELRPRRLDIVDAERERMGARLELPADRGRVHQLKRQVPGLELTAWDAPVVDRLLEAEDVP